MKITNLLKNKVVKNAGWLIWGRVYHMVLSFVFSLLTARYLGPDNFGLINYATTYTTFFASLCTLGINSIIIKNFVDKPEEIGETIGTALFLRLLSSLASCVMIFSASFVLDYGETVTQIVVLLTSFGIIFQIMDTFNYWFQLNLQSKYSTIATIVSYSIVSIYRFYLLYTNQKVEWFALATSLDYLIVGMLLYYIYIKNGGPKISWSWKKGKELLLSSHHFILAGLMVSIYGATDRFMLKQLLSQADVGYYSIALAVCNMWVFILSAIIDSLYPSVLQSFADKKVFDKKNKQLYAIVFYLSFFASLIIMLFAPLIIDILYGSNYTNSVMPLRIVTWYTAFSYLGVARNAWLVSYNKQNYLKYLYVGAAIANVVLNALLIPQYGPSGAAFASLVTQFSTIFIFPLFIKEIRYNTKLMFEAILLKFN